MARLRRKRPRIHLFSKLMLVLNTFAIISLLISYLASYADPATIWIMPFFGLAYPVFLIINILFVFYWLIRLPKFALLSLVTILLGWNVIQNYIGFRGESFTPNLKSSESNIRVMTYNVHNFKKFGDKNDPFTKDEILDLIRKEQPDIICFQEFFTRKSGAYNFKKFMKEILETEYYYFKPSTDNGYEAIGMAIFSKFPIVNHGNIQFAKKMNWNEAVYVDVKKEDKTFRVYNVHFQSINFQPEDYQFLKNVPNKIDAQSSKKIGARLKFAFIKRSTQVKMLKEHTDSCTIPYIIAGDFNDTPISYTVNTISKGMNNSFRQKGSGLGITYNGVFPNFQIDYIFTTPDFNIMNYQIINKKLSDHYPIRTDLELK